MDRTDDSYPAGPLRKELYALGLPEEKHGRKSLEELLNRSFKAHYPLERSVDELAEILIYLGRKNLVSFRQGPD